MHGTHMHMSHAHGMCMCMAGRNSFWLPHHCTQRSTTRQLSGNTLLKKAVCGGAGRDWRAPQAAIECRQDARPCKTGYDMTFESREVLHMMCMPAHVGTCWHMHMSMSISMSMSMSM